MEQKSGTLVEWLVPLAFILCAGWTVWNGPAYIMALSDPELDDIIKMAARYPALNLWSILSAIGCVIFFIIGTSTVRRAAMEFESWRTLDRVAVFIGRVTMMLVVVLTCVMIYEVILRYVFERPTLWANEMSLWLAGFVFLLSGFYAMQQRSHIRIFLLYDMLPKNLQRFCDVVSTAMIITFAFFLVYGGYGEAFDKFARWETFGTAFDPPIPATLKVTVLIVIPLVAIQSIINLISDWNAEPVVHSAADDIDQDELERIRRAVGADKEEF